jgi:hypothetical protein
MRCSRLLLAAVLGLTIGVFHYTASAAPCCSSPLCQQDIPPPICALCGNCVAGADDGIDYAHDFDADAGVCFPV